MHLSICTTSETLEEARAVIGAFIDGVDAPSRRDRNVPRWY